MTMEKTISKKNFIKASKSKPSGNPPPGDKTLSIEPDIRFYATEDGCDTEEGEESEILVIYF